MASQVAGIAAARCEPVDIVGDVQADYDKLDETKRYGADEDWRAVCRARSQIGARGCDRVREREIEGGRQMSRD